MAGSGDFQEDRVRQLAFELWEKAGEPEGRDDEFWHQAIREVSSAPSDEAFEAAAVPETKETLPQQPDTLRGKTTK